jgi:hypothetical protein
MFISPSDLNFIDGRFHITFASYRPFSSIGKHESAQYLSILAEARAYAD